MFSLILLLRNSVRHILSEKHPGGWRERTPRWSKRCEERLGSGKPWLVQADSGHGSKWSRKCFGKGSIWGTTIRTQAGKIIYSLTQFTSWSWWAMPSSGTYLWGWRDEWDVAQTLRSSQASDEPSDGNSRHIWRLKHRPWILFCHGTQRRQRI